MPVAATPSSSDRNKPKRYPCNLCSKTFDDIDTLNSHKKLDPAAPKMEKGQSLRRPLVLANFYSYSLRTNS